MEYLYKIRAHHGMCIAFFQGKGYSDEFVIHMKSVIGSLKENPNIMIVSEADDICLKCPNNKDGICVSEDKVKAYDRDVLRLCGLEDGMIMSYMDFERMVYDSILIPHKREDVCSSCQWDALCKNPISRD